MKDKNYVKDKDYVLVHIWATNFKNENSNAHDDSGHTSLEVNYKNNLSYLSMWPGKKFPEPKFATLKTFEEDVVTKKKSPDATYQLLVETEQIEKVHKATNQILEMVNNNEPTVQYSGSPEKKRESQYTCTSIVEKVLNENTEINFNSKNPTYPNLLAYRLNSLSSESKTKLLSEPKLIQSALDDTEKRVIKSVLNSTERRSNL